MIAFLFAPTVPSEPRPVSYTHLDVYKRQEGDSTATYMNKVLKQFDLKITKLASGLPVGGDIEYADQVTLGRALMGRTEL